MPFRHAAGQRTMPKPECAIDTMKLQRVSVWFFAIVLLALAANAMFLVLIKRSYDEVVSARDHRERDQPLHDMSPRRDVPGAAGPPDDP